MPEVLDWKKFNSINDTYYIRNIQAPDNFTKWSIVGNDLEEWQSMSDQNISNFGNLKSWVLYRHFGVGVKYEGAIIRDSCQYVMNTGCQVKEINPKVKSVIAIVPCVINVGLTSKFTFAHIMLDVLPAILLCPESVIRRAYVVHVDFPTSHKTKYLYSLAGIPPERVIIANGEQAVYALESWSPYPHTCMNKFYYPLKLLRVRILKNHPFMGKAFRFVILQRMPNWANRHILNIEKLKEEASLKYPGIEWMVQEAPSDLEDSMKFFASVKFLFLVGGSAFANMYFMQPKTVVAEMMSECNYIPSGILAVACDVKYCVSRQKSIKHTDGPQLLDIIYAMKLIDVACSRL